MSGSRSSQPNISANASNSASTNASKVPSSAHAIETNIEPASQAAPQAAPQAVDQSAELTDDPSQSELSKRELQIVELVSAGLTNQEISEKLDISKRTVDNHVSNVLNKTATGNRVALVRWALQSGKVCIDELNCCHLPEN